MRVLVINGPNLNMLGRRSQSLYGNETLKSIEEFLAAEAGKLGVEPVFFQSNHEGALIDFIQKEAPGARGIIINAGALTHYGYALHDALVDSALPAVEVHLSNVQAREEWRRKSVIGDATIGQIAGFKKDSYRLALIALVGHIGSR